MRRDSGASSGGRRSTEGISAPSTSTGTTRRPRSSAEPISKRTTSAESSSRDRSATPAPTEPGGPDQGKEDGAFVQRTFDDAGEVETRLDRVDVHEHVGVAVALSQPIVEPACQSARYRRGGSRERLGGEPSSPTSSGRRLRDLFPGLDGSGTTATIEPFGRALASHCGCGPSAGQSYGRGFQRLRTTMPVMCPADPAVCRFRHDRSKPWPRSAGLLQTLALAEGAPRRPWSHG